MADNREASGQLTPRQITGARRLAFGTHRFEPASGLLWRGGRETRLTPRAAALLQALAERATEVVTKQALIARLWNGQAVGDDALTSCMQELRRALGDDPRRPALIETLHRRGYRLLVPCQPADEDESTWNQAPSDGAPAVPADRPSIAVLPFRNLTGNADQQYFIDGLVEDIIGALSRLRWLLVIAGSSSFTFKDDPEVDIAIVARRLGVRYVLRGSVPKSADRIRIAGQLIDSATGAHLWADAFEGGSEDVFALQDRVTSQIYAALVPQLDKAEIERALRKPTDRLEAYDLCLQGRASMMLWTEAGTERALSLYLRAIELDPNYASAHGRAAVCYARRRAYRWGRLDSPDIAEADRLARRAWALDQNDPVAIGPASMALALGVRDLDTAVTYIERALALNPNNTLNWSYGGWINVWLGRGETAVDHFQRALRLSPIDPHRFDWETGIAFALYFAGRHAEALGWAERALEKAPGSHAALRIAAAAAAMDGRMAEARGLCDRLRALDPGLTLGTLAEVLGPYRDPEHPVRFAEGLRRAGLPA